MDSKTFIDSLTGKVGPLPGYAWVAIGVGGIYWYRKKHPSSSVVVSSSPAAAPVSSSTPADISGGSMDTSNAANQLYQSSPYTLEQIQQAIANAASGGGSTPGQQSILDQLTQIQAGQQSIQSQILNSPLYQPPVEQQIISPAPAPVTNNPFVPINPTTPVTPTPQDTPTPTPVSPYSNGSTARAGGLAGAGSVRGD